jgi:hypothetical protein
MKKIIVILGLIACSMAYGSNITAGDVTQKDVLDSLGMKAWAWDIQDDQGFDSVTVDVEIFKRNKQGKWENLKSSGHGRSYAENRKFERVVLIIRDDTLFLKVGDSYGELDIDLEDYDIESLVFHDVGGTGKKVDDGIIVASQFIQRNMITSSIEDRDFYILVRITPKSDPAAGGNV